MIRKSNKTRDEIRAAMMTAMPRFQDATDLVDDAAAELLGVNRTDLRCLGLLTGGPMTAGTLAERSGLTRGAMTTALDRMERSGLARRTPDPDDRRSVLVGLTPRAIAEFETIWGPIRDEGLRVFEAWSTEELDAALRFLEASRIIQEAHAARIRALPR